VTRRRRVLAIGWFGENNLGDEAMLDGLLRLLHRALDDPDVTVATRDPADTAAAFGTKTMRRPTPADAGFTNRELLWASLRSHGKLTIWDRLSGTMVRYRTRRTTAI